MMNNHLLVIPELLSKMDRTASSDDGQRSRKRHHPVEIHQHDDATRRVDVIPSDEESASEESCCPYQPNKKSRRIDYEWKEDGRVDAVRNQMRSVLEQRMNQKSSDKNPEQAIALLEKLLYARASSFNDYLCLDSLDTKLKRVMEGLLERKLRKAEIASDRRSALVEALGDETKYEQTASLVEEIKRLRNGQISCLPSSPSTTEQTPSSTRDQQQLQHQLQLSKLAEPRTKLAPPVRALFLGTELVTAWESTPIEELRGLCWDKLITRAEAIVEDFRNWMSS